MGGCALKFVYFDHAVYMDISSGYSSFKLIGQLADELFYLFNFRNVHLPVMISTKDIFRLT